MAVPSLLHGCILYPSNCIHDPGHRLSRELR
jgi:hypothetical protein